MGKNKKMKILVVAAHPDDEVLGLGGTILRHTSCGDDVYVCIVTKAYQPRWSKEYMAEKLKEQKIVDGMLGIKKRFNLGLQTARLNTLPHGEFNQMITDLVDEIGPDMVYTHCEDDLHLDHSLIFKAVKVATKPPKKIALLCYETLSETEWGSSVFSPNIWVDINRFLKRKIDAFKVYGSEVKTYPHPRSEKGIEVLAAKRGMESGLKAAECFKLIRGAGFLNI